MSATPPVPALPDTERLTSYSISAQTGPFSVNFALYGDGTDYGNWVQVWLEGAELTPATDWTLASVTGDLSTIPRPITDATVTLTAAGTGTLQIVGARRPRRAAQFTENRGVAARDLNQLITDVIAQNRETWDMVRDRAMLVPPGEILSPQLPSAALRANKLLYFDGSGDPILSSITITGTMGVIALSLTRSQISSSTMAVNTFMVAGYAAPGDLGAGAIYTSNSASSGSIGAIQDAAGTWFRLVIYDVVKPGWFGVKGDGVTVDTVAFVAAYSAAALANARMILPPGTFPVASLIWNQDVDVIGPGPLNCTFKPTANSQTVIKITEGAPSRTHIITVGYFSIDGTGFTGITGLRSYLLINDRLDQIATVNCETGWLSEGDQFCVFDQMVASTNSKAGIRVVDDLTGVNGGGNNNEFRSLDVVNNLVGLMVGRTGNPFPMGLNKFTNLVSQGNTLCGAFFINQESTEVSEYSPDSNCSSGSTSATVYGEAVTRSGLQAVTSNLLLPNYQSVQTTEGPTLAQNGSFLTITGGSGQAQPMQADATSIIDFEGHPANGSIFKNCILRLQNIDGAASVLVTGPSFYREDQSFPNLTQNPSYPDILGVTDASDALDTDADLGMVQSISYLASAGSISSNNATIKLAASGVTTPADLFVAYLIQSDVDTSLTMSGPAGAYSFDLAAGVWTRVFCKNHDSTIGTSNNYMVLWPTDSAGATIKITRVIHCADITPIQARYLSEQHPFNPNDKQGCRSKLNAAPTVGTWKAGDLVWDESPTSGQFIGWVCTVAGTPGTWKSWGAIS